MKIQKLTLDDNDVKQAVQDFLEKKGISMPVHSVSKPYSWSEMEVTFTFQDEVAPPSPKPRPATVDVAGPTTFEEVKPALEPTTGIASETKEPL